MILFSRQLFSFSVSANELSLILWATIKRQLSKIMRFLKALNVVPSWHFRIMTMQLDCWFNSSRWWIPEKKVVSEKSIFFGGRNYPKKFMFHILKNMNVKMGQRIIWRQFWDGNSPIDLAFQMKYLLLLLEKAQPIQPICYSIFYYAKPVFCSSRKISNTISKGIKYITSRVMRIIEI